MFYIDHGTIKKEENVIQIFDARTYQWKTVPPSSNKIAYEQFHILESELSGEWFNNNCSPNGYFKCNRCYRKHNVPDNFDLLCDGCTEILKEYHAEGFSFDFTAMFNDWLTNPSNTDIQASTELRSAFDLVFKTDILFYQEKEIIIVRNLFKNNGDLEVIFKEDDFTNKQKRFIVNVNQIQIALS